MVSIRLSLLIEHSSSVLGTGKATPQVPCLVLGPPLQEGHWSSGMSPEKGCRAGEESGAQVLWAAAEGSGVVWPGEREAQGSLLLSTTPWKEMVEKARWRLVSSPRQPETVWEEIASSCARGGLVWTSGGISSQKWWLDTGLGCPRRWWSHRPWRCVRKDWM